MNEDARKKTPNDGDATPGIHAATSASFDRSGNTLRPKDIVPLEIEYGGVNAFLSEYLRHLRHGHAVITTGRPIPTGMRFLFLLKAPHLELSLQVHGTVMQASEQTVEVQLAFASEDERRQLEQTVVNAMRRELGTELTDRLLDLSIS